MTQLSLDDVSTPLAAGQIFLEQNITVFAQKMRQAESKGRHFQYPYGKCGKIFKLHRDDSWNTFSCDLDGILQLWRTYNKCIGLRLNIRLWFLVTTHTFCCFFGGFGLIQWFSIFKLWDESVRCRCLSFLVTLSCALCGFSFNKLMISSPDDRAPRLYG